MTVAGHAEPSTRPEIVAALHALHRTSVEYWDRFPTATFLAPLGNAWSPAENVRHLTKSMRALTKGLQVPRLILLLRFGRASAPSRPYGTVRDVYRARLAVGADAGPFAPNKRPPGADPQAERAEVMAHHAAAVAGLATAISGWSERALDRRRLPHPLLGPLTVREMLFFTLYHGQHHLDVVQRRVGTAD